MRKAVGDDVPAMAEPGKSDGRFKSELWQNNLVFDYIKQSYLIAAKHLQQSVAGVQGLDEHTARKVDFYTRQYIDALAPTNFRYFRNPSPFRPVASASFAKSPKCW